MRRRAWALRVGQQLMRLRSLRSKNFLQPWSATLNSSLQAAIKSRQNVKSARCVLEPAKSCWWRCLSELLHRISLDACRSTLTHATGGPKQEQARMDGESDRVRERHPAHASAPQSRPPRRSS